MWAVRRAATNPLRGRVYRILAYRNSYVLGDERSNGVGKFSDNHNRGQFVVTDSFAQKRLLDHIACTKFFPGGRFISSQAGSDSDSDEDKLEDGFSELEDPEGVNKIENDNEDGVVHWASGSESFENDDSGEGLLEKHEEIELLEDEVGPVDEGKKSLKSSSSPLVPIIIRSPPSSIKAAINKWVKHGNSVNESVVLQVMATLRRRKLFGKALQFSEWSEENDAVTFTVRDYAARVDLIAKVHGLDSAELYIKKIPPDMQTEVVYRTLMANCSFLNNVKKAEQTFNLMRDKGFPLTAFTCNRLLLLYKRHDKKKLADVLLMMEKENVKPTLFTYNILINAKGETGDYDGMDQVIENMKSEGIVPDLHAQAIAVKYYIYGKLKEKAMAIVKEMEGNDKTSRAACKYLLPIYASLGKSDDVDRLWKLCESNPQLEESMAAIEAWGKLRNTENAEAVFEKAINTWKKLPQGVYLSLLKTYADNKLLAKGKELVKRMLDNGCWIGPLVWDAIVKLYVQSDEPEKAASFLNKVVQQNDKPKPFYRSYLTVLEKYAQRGDIHNAEKIFERARQAGYRGKVGLYKNLLRAYQIAKKPAYGFRERLKADNLFPDRILTMQLAQLELLKNSVVAEVLE